MIKTFEKLMKIVVFLKFRTKPTDKLAAWPDDDSLGIVPLQHVQLRVAD